MKAGTVALIGRPNTGKSTLVNNLVGHKVAITSPKPQTTQFPIYAVYEDPSPRFSLRQAARESRGQIIFVDTPGIFAKIAKGQGSHVNLEARKVLREKIDLILYVVDPTRRRGLEENRVLGLMRGLDIPKILVINKIDLEQKYLEEYKFMEDEFDKVVQISAIKNKNLGLLLDEIFKMLPIGEKIVKREDMAIPAINISSKIYIAEIIREKAFLNLRDELPYKIKVEVDEIIKRKNGMIYIKARILTSDRYKKMIIGHSGQMIKEISRTARKELELSTKKKIYLEVKVEEE